MTGGQSHADLVSDTDRQKHAHYTFIHVATTFINLVLRKQIIGHIVASVSVVTVGVVVNTYPFFAVRLLLV